jgi:hypothetical protein
MAGQGRQWGVEQSLARCGFDDTTSRGLLGYHQLRMRYVMRESGLVPPTMPTSTLSPLPERRRDATDESFPSEAVRGVMLRG